MDNQNPSTPQDATAFLTQAFAAEAAQATSQPGAPAPVPVLAQNPLAAPAVPPQAPVAPVPPPTQSSLQPQEAVAAPTQEQVAAVQANAINDQALYAVPQSDGTTATMSGKEMRESILRQGDYTRKTQALAQQRQEVEKVIPTLQQLQQRQQALDADLNNEAAVADYALRRFGPAFVQRLMQMQPAAPQAPAPLPLGNPEDVASQGFVHQQTQGIEARFAQLEQRHQTELAQLRGELTQVNEGAKQSAETARQQAINDIQTANHRQVINAAIPEIVKQHPIIEAVPHYEDILRFNVLNKYQPRTAQEAVQCFQLEAKALEAQIVGKFQAQQKTQLVQQAQQSLVQNGLATAGIGAAITAQAQGPQVFLDKDGRGDWKAIQAGVADMMRAQFAQQ